MNPSEEWILENRNEYAGRPYVRSGFYVTENGSLIYNDLATSEKYDFVKFVAKLKNLSYYGAVEQIAKDFNVSGNKDFTVSTTTIKPIVKKPKDLFKDILFWDDYF